MSNLRLLNETTITSAVSNVSITDVFTSDFKIYKMTMVYDNSAGNVLKTQMINTDGIFVNSNNYDWAILQLRATGSDQEQNQEDDNHWRMSYEGTAGWNVTTYLFNPFSSTEYTHFVTESSGYYGGAGLTNINLKGNGVLRKAESMSGIKFTAVGSTIDDFTCRIYGLRVDT